jgi:hypothetical protein
LERRKGEKLVEEEMVEGGEAKEKERGARRRWREVMCARDMQWAPLFKLLPQKL